VYNLQTELFQEGAIISPSCSTSILFSWLDFRLSFTFGESSLIDEIFLLNISSRGGLQAAVPRFCSLGWTSQTQVPEVIFPARSLVLLIGYILSTMASFFWCTLTYHIWLVKNLAAFSDNDIYLYKIEVWALPFICPPVECIYLICLACWLVITVF
jgi:hypothetical protein